MATITPANPAVPMAVVHYFVDAAGVVQQVGQETPYPVVNSCGYVLVSTAGTSTVKATNGVFYGASTITAGTNSALQILDGTNVLVPTTTNTAVGSLATGLPAGGIGVQFDTSILVVVTGTAVSTAAIFFE